MVLTKTWASQLKTEPRTSEESVKSPSSSPSVVKSASLPSFPPTPRTETSARPFTKKSISLSTSASSTPLSRSVKKETSRDSTREPELERSKTSLASLILTRRPKPQTLISRLTCSASSKASIWCLSR